MKKILLLSILTALATPARAAQDSVSLYGLTQWNDQDRALLSVVGNVEVSTSAKNKSDPSIILAGRLRRLTVADQGRVNVTTITPTGIYSPGQLVAGMLTSTSTIEVGVFGANRGAFFMHGGILISPDLAWPSFIYDNMSIQPNSLETLTSDNSSHIRFSLAQDTFFDVPYKNFGIGTRTPSYKLDVIGAGHFSDGVYGQLYGDVLSTGTITANTYYGDGSHLTSLPIPDSGYETVITTCPASKTCIAVCPGVKKVLGGGCKTGGLTYLTDNAPEGDMEYKCGTSISIDLVAVAKCGNK